MALVFKASHGRSELPVPDHTLIGRYCILQEQRMDATEPQIWQWLQNPSQTAKKIISDSRRVEVGYQLLGDGGGGWRQAALIWG